MSTMPAILTALESTTPDPRTRIRVNHSRTQRGGWQYETTVEVEWSGADDGDALYRLQSLLTEAREVAKRERDERNAEDGE